MLELTRIFVSLTHTFIQPCLFYIFNMLMITKSLTLFSTVITVTENSFLTPIVAYVEEIYETMLSTDKKDLKKIEFELGSEHYVDRETIKK